jgi:FAD synthetase
MSKKAVDKKKIMVFGTFDGLHKGHLNFFKQARALKTLVPGQARLLHQFPFLIVSIARDKNVFKIKGKYPNLPERARMVLVEKCKLVDRVVLSGIKNHLPHIIKIRPDIIALGYDQKAYVQNLKKDLKNKGIFTKIVRLKPYKEKIYKNHLLKIKK